MIFVFFLLAAPVASQAAVSPGDFTPQVEIPGFIFNKSDPSTGNIAYLIRAIYDYAIGIVGILAAVVLMVGGVLWIVAGGNATQIGEAKAWIGAALTGLILALTSYLILTTVNPALVNLKTTKIDSVAELKTGSCTTTVSGVETCTNVSDSTQCKPPGIFSTNICPMPCCAYTMGSYLSGQGDGKYKNCIDYQENLTKDICKLKHGDDTSEPSYLPDGQCKNYISSPFSPRYNCVPISK